MMPMIQGVVYNLAWCGWSHWNRNVQLNGNSIGAKVRRWWYGVNNWSINNGRQVSGEKGWWR